MPATLQAICGRDFQKVQLQSAQMNCETLLGLKANLGIGSRWGCGVRVMGVPSSQQGCHPHTLGSRL